MKTLAVYCGRFNPIHVGHESVINNMIEQFGFENIIIIIGSSNTGQSLRHFFSYNERRNFIQKIYPGITVVGLPDYGHDDEWMAALDDIIYLRKHNQYDDQIFFGGCEEDISFFLERDRVCTILNRFDGTTPKISATEVRDDLISGRNLEGKINDTITDDIVNLFAEKWEKFKKM